LPRTGKQRAYDQRRHHAAVNRGTKPLVGCLMPVLVLIGLGVLLVGVWLPPTRPGLAVTT